MLEKMPERPGKKTRLYGVRPSERKQPGYNRVRSADEYHTYRWTKESKAFREAHPLCAECKKRGLLQPSEVVDHIVPFPVCGDFWNQENWQALCSRCNAAKGNKDKKLITGYKQKHQRHENTNR